MGNNNEDNKKVVSKKNITTKNKRKVTKKKNKLTVGKILKSIFLFVMQFVILISLLGGGVGSGYIFGMIKTTPKLDVNKILSVNQTSSMFDKDGQLIDLVPSEEERFVVKYEDMPKNLINAYVSIEDERFMSHGGVDFKRIVGSTIGNIKFLIKGEGMAQGGSTITQQLLKNTLLYAESTSERGYIDSINRKIKEIYLALKLENILNKEQIMEAYLNLIPLGGRMYGVEAASRYYFNKSVKDLSLAECAYIAGITQAPTYYSAYNTEAENYPESYIYRTKTVLMKMRDLGYITPEEHDIAYAEVNENKLAFGSGEVNYKLAYEWYIYPAMEQVKADLKEKFKYSDDQVNKYIMTGGLKIYTAMDRKMQDAVQGVLNNRENLAVDDGAEPMTEEGTFALQAAATVMNYKTGEVVAMIGGRGEQPPSSLNRAYYDFKPIASNTKPLTVYGAAIDSKTITAATPIDDAPIPSSILDKYATDWSPNNYDFSFDGFITAREAIAFSKNITSIRTVDKMGLDVALEYGKNAGLVYNSVSEKSMSALALGQFDNSPTDRDGGNTTIMASALGAIGNSGVRMEPSFYTKVEDASGRIILEREPKSTKLFSPQTAYIMYDILKEPVKRFDASGAKFSEMPVAGKTGTTENVDLFWFSGLTPYYSASVYIGYDVPQKMSGYSSSAAKLWGKVMAEVHSGLETTELEEPSGIKKAKICMDSGKLAADACYNDPRGGRTRTEMFIEGTEPTTYCSTHVYIKINKANNKIATENTPQDLIIDKVFIKKDYASSSASDYQYVIPTTQDDTKPLETYNLEQIGLSIDMDLFEAMAILDSHNISYKIYGVDKPTDKGQAVLTKFPATAKEETSVNLGAKKKS